MQSIGASVEYGNIQGGVFNVVTKQGGARFESRRVVLRAALRPDRAASRPPGDRGHSAHERVRAGRYRDFTTNLGGPVVRDRLWFFGAYQYLATTTVSPARIRRSAKVRAEQDLRKAHVATDAVAAADAELSQESGSNPTPPTLATPFVATLRMHASVPSMTFANLTHVLSDSTVWDGASAGSS